MNLMKWFRKNNMKVMAIVIIIILFGFIGGEFFRQLGQRKTGRRRTIAYFWESEKITNNDLFLAQQELGVLKGLGADLLLRSIKLPLFRKQDLQAFLLGQLLFSDRRVPPQLINQIKQTIVMDKYRISDKQISGIYTGPVNSGVYWLLLRNETEQAGIRASNEESRTLLAGAIPQLFNGTKYSQLIEAMVKRQGVPEKYILATFGKLLAVLQYAKIVCSSEGVTSSQIMHSARWDNETIDVEFVKLDSAVFAETQDEPDEERIVEHFDKYKKFSAGDIGDQNPYGFGYKLPGRAKLEYIAVKLDDISKIVPKPTQEETEEYYQRYSEQLTTQAPSDPNDPNSPLIERTMSYGEVASDISKLLLQNKTDSKSVQIMQEARMLTEVGFEDIVTEDLSAEQFRRAAMASDYKTVAEQLTEKYKVKVYAGQTGLLSADDIQSDEHLAKLYLRGYGYNPVRLYQLIFAIDELGTSELGLFDIPKPRMYENIGPMRDISELMQLADTSGRIMAIVRVVEAQKASEPESVNQVYSRETLKFEQDQEQDSEAVYSVKEKVAEDLKKLAAMDATKSKAEELIEEVAKDGWLNAIAKLNEIYRQQTKQNESDPNVFELQNFTNLQRISTVAMATWAAQSQGNPIVQSLVNDAQKESLLRNQFYSLVPQDSNTVDALPLVMEFKPDMSYYCLKNISVRRLEKEQYEIIKAMQVYKEDVVECQSLAAVHLNPVNILRRMNFRWVVAEETTDANTPVASAESEEAL